MTSILVTGATGAVGSNVVRELQERGVPVRAFVRDTDRAAAVLGDRVELVAGDFRDQASIRNALGGVECVFLCSPNNPQQVEHETNVIDAAADARIRRMVKIGANGAQIGSPLEFWDAHARIEQHLLESGLPSVVLHPSSYTSNLLASADSIKHMASCSHRAAPKGH